MAKAVAVSQGTFQAEVLTWERPVLVDFWATWCGPCRIIGPVVEELAGEYEGRLKVAKVDVDANPELAESYGVRSIPTLLLFQGGRVVDQAVGAVPKSLLKRRIESVLLKTSSKAA